MPFRDRSSYNMYMKQYMLDRYHKRRREAIRQLGGICCAKGCSSRKNLQFDHRDPKKKSFSIGFRLAGMAEKKLQVELKKCQLLCVDHHIEKTLMERGQKRARGTHGTLAAIRYCGKPLCDACRKAYNDYAREYKRRRRRFEMTR